MSTTAHASYSGSPREPTSAPVIATHVLFGILFGILGFMAFCGVLALVTDGARGAVRFDTSILMWMDRHHAPALTAVARVLAYMGSPPVIIVVAGVGMVAGFVNRSIRGAAWTFPIAAAGAGVIIQGVKLGVHRARPDLFAPLLKEHGYSFPSGHSLIAITIYGLIGYFALGLTQSRGARVAIVAATSIVILAIGVSRVYVGVHYPTDVLAGWSAGAPWLVICIGLHEVMARRWGRAGQTVLDRPPAITRAVRKVTKEEERLAQ